MLRAGAGESDGNAATVTSSRADDPCRLAGKRLPARERQAKVMMTKAGWTKKLINAEGRNRHGHA